MSQERSPDSRRPSLFDRFLKKLYSHTPLSSPKPSLERHRNGDGLKQPLETGTVRRETIALAAYFIEKSWASSKAWIKAYPPGVVSVVDLSDGSFAAVPVHADEALDPAKQQTTTEVIAVINQWMLSTFSLGMQDVWRTLGQEELKPSEQQSYDFRSYARYAFLLSHADTHDDPIDQIQVGVSSGLRTVSSLFAALPLVFLREEQRQITIDEATAILKSSVRTVELMASMYINNFLQSESSMNEGEEGFFSPDSFVLVGEGEERRLEPAPHVYAKVRALPSEGSPRVGCPGLYVKGESGMSFFEELMEWYLQIAKTYYFPRLQEFTENMIAASGRG